MLLTELFQTLKCQQRTAFELTLEERALVDSLYLYGTGKAQSMAKGLYEYVNRFSSTDCPVLSTNDRAGGNAGPRPSESLWPTGENKAVSVSVSPNPATTWVSVDYNLPFAGRETRMTISNSMGVTVKTVYLQGERGNKVLDLRELKKGVYYYTVSRGSEKVFGKLVITD